MSTLHHDSSFLESSPEWNQQHQQHTLPPLQQALPPEQQHWHHHHSIQTTPRLPQQQPANEPAGRIIFTRQLWQRTMPNGNHHPSEQRVLNSRSQARDNVAVAAGESSSRRASSTVSSQRSSHSQQRRSSPPSPDSQTPLTPEESPPFSRTTALTRKRTAGIVENEDKELEGEASPGPAALHSRQGSADSGVHVCICQPDPKIPRPRNAFILYRQHHQASVIAQNPGLANPEISKIIGEQWQNQAPEVKNKWKALAEEEKIRHQQQYPTYRYQPKRNGRRNSINSETGEKPRCPKCGGRSILAPSTPYSNINSGLQTPGSAITPVSRTLPVLKDLSLQSPAARRMGKQFPGGSMLPGHHPDERDDLGPLTPDLKRRRFNGEPPAQLTRAMPPRYVHAPVGPPVQPGTPFPFSQAPPPHPYPPGANHVRRDSLPGLRGMVSPPGPMGPPPRPGPGYQQHRLSQGHVPHDRSLTLPPLQTGSNANVPPAMATGGLGMTTKEQIMNMDFRNKVHILRRVAPPVPVEKNAPRGPLVSIEGDNFEAVKELSIWLAETLRKGDDLNVSLLEGPQLSPEGNKESLMAQYHRLAAEWLDKSSEIRESLAMPVTSPTDSVMVDGSTPTPAARKASNREIDEDYDESDDSSSKVRQIVKAGPDNNDDNTSRRTSPSTTEKMDVDNSSTKASISSSGPSKEVTTSNSPSSKPVSIIANYALYASNFFACKIPIDAHDPYAPNDHWQWTATQWRGIISPDLTIYVRDGIAGDTGKQSVDILDEGNLFVVKRTKGDGKDDDHALEVEPSTLRRLGFEVSEWVRAFGVKRE